MEPVDLLHRHEAAFVIWDGVGSVLPMFLLIPLICKAIFMLDDFTLP